MSIKEKQQYRVTYEFKYIVKVEVHADSEQQAKRLADDSIDPDSFGGATVGDIKIEKL